MKRKFAIVAALVVAGAIAGTALYISARHKDEKKARAFFDTLVHDEQTVASTKEWDQIAPMVRKYYAEDAIVGGVVSASGPEAPTVDLRDTTVSRDQYIALFEKNMAAMDGYNFQIEPPDVAISSGLRYAILSYDLKEEGLLKGFAGKRGFPLQLTSSGRCAMVLDLRSMLIRKATCNLMADVMEKPATEIVGHTVE